MSKAANEQDVLSFPELKTFDLKTVMTGNYTLAPNNATGRAIVNELNTKLAAMDAIADKFDHGQSLMSEMDINSVRRFSKLVQDAMAELKAVEDTDSYPFTQEFTVAIIQTAARQFFGSVEIGALAIAREIAASPYPPAPEKRPGFFKRLFGGAQSPE